MHEHDPEVLEVMIGDALGGIITAMARSVGPCRFEAATLRSSGLVPPAIRAAAERLVGGSLLDRQLLRRDDDVLVGKLNKRALHMLGTRCVTQGGHTSCGNGG